jgi:serine O-acetyltransferase
MTDAKLWREPDATRPLPFWKSIVADLRERVPPDNRPASTSGWLRIAARVAVFQSDFRAVLNYRLAHTARFRLGALGKPLSYACYLFGQHWHGCSIAPTSRLHGGLVMPHPRGITIGPGAVIGPGSWIFQNVTIGGTAGRAGMPCIGQGARVYCGAVIVGPIVIGDHVAVGANAVVTKDVPSDSLVRVARATVEPQASPASQF